MNDPYVSLERRKSSLQETGVQYLPGHEESFVDLVIARYLPEGGRILDLAGGGLRFAIPVALKERPIIVVDRDEGSLDVNSIIHRVAANDRIRVDPLLCHKHITVIAQEVREFLRTTGFTFTLITAFRLTPYFTPPALSDLFALISAKLDPGGTFAVSGLSPRDLVNGPFNEIYKLTEAVGGDQLYREFCDLPAATDLRREQNLPRRMLFNTKESIDSLGQAHGLTMVEEGIRSTRIFAGYILRKHVASK